jgi:hypothetical protein
MLLFRLHAEDNQKRPANAKIAARLCGLSRYVREYCRSVRHDERRFRV